MPTSKLSVEQEKLFIQQCLIEAERLIRDKRLAEAKVQIEKAKKIDPNNVYIKSFIERINFLEKRTVAGGAISQTVAAESTTEETLLRISASVSASQPSQISTLSIRDLSAEKSVTELQLEEMQRQVALLQKAVEEEKRARQEINRDQIQQGLEKLRNDLRKVWINGSPAKEITEQLYAAAASLTIPQHVMNRLQREVKIEMFSNAVGQISAKKQLVRNSASSMDWLRKVYDISAEEYLEYESKFLADLTSDHYKGTIFQISSDEHSISVINENLKAQGYAVVVSFTPEEALEKIEKLTPNVIISESEFGPNNISGIRFLHFLRNNSKFNFIPFIFVAGEEDFSLLSSSELRSNEGFVKKPVIFNELFSVMNAKLEWLKEYSTSLRK